MEIPYFLGLIWRARWQRLRMWWLVWNVRQAISPSVGFKLLQSADRLRSGQKFERCAWLWKCRGVSSSDTRKNFVLNLKTLHPKTAMIQKVYWKNTLSKARMSRWHKTFKEGRESVEDEQRTTYDQRRLESANRSWNRCFFYLKVLSRWSSYPQINCQCCILHGSAQTAENRVACVCP